MSDCYDFKRSGKAKCLWLMVSTSCNELPVGVNDHDTVDDNHLMQASEGNPKVVSILEESEVARDSVKVNPNSCGDIFPEKGLSLHTHI